VAENLGQISDFYPIKIRGGVRVGEVSESIFEAQPGTGSHILLAQGHFVSWAIQQFLRVK